MNKTSTTIYEKKGKSNIMIIIIMITIKIITMIIEILEHIGSRKNIIMPFIEFSM